MSPRKQAKAQSRFTEHILHLERFNKLGLTEFGEAIIVAQPDVIKELEYRRIKLKMMLVCPDCEGDHLIVIAIIHDGSRSLACEHCRKIYTLPNGGGAEEQLYLEFTVIPKEQIKANPIQLQQGNKTI